MQACGTAEAVPFHRLWRTFLLQLSIATRHSALSTQTSQPFSVMRKLAPDDGLPCWRACSPSAHGCADDQCTQSYGRREHSHQIWRLVTLALARSDRGQPLAGPGPVSGTREELQLPA